MGVVDGCGDCLIFNMNLFFSEAKIQFTKYAAPLLYLSGMDVTVVEVHIGIFPGWMSPFIVTLVQMVDGRVTFTSA